MCGIRVLPEKAMPTTSRDVGEIAEDQNTKWVEKSRAGKNRRGSRHRCHLV